MEDESAEELKEQVREECHYVIEPDLTYTCFADEKTDFNMVLMNPPYSAKWSAAAGFLQDERFSDYGVLAPKSKADYAFLLHGLYHLKRMTSI